MTNPKIIRCQLTYTGLTKKEYEKNPKLFETIVIYIRLDELQEKGMYMKKRNKPTRFGTAITFEPVRSQEEYKTELEKIISDGEKLGLEFERMKDR